MTHWRWALLAVSIGAGLSRPAVLEGRGQSPNATITAQGAESLRERRWAEQTFYAWAEGNQRKRTAAALRDSPGTPSTIVDLLEGDRPSDAIGQLTAAINADPAAMIAALSAAGQSSYRFSMDQTRSPDTGLRTVVERASARLASFPREQAAQAAYVLLPLETTLDQLSGLKSTWQTRLQSIASTYRGTAAGLTAELDLLSTPSPTINAQGWSAKADQMDQFWRNHPGTAAGAKALYLKGQAIRQGQTVYNVPHQPDPTDRLVQMVAIVDELQSGQYPDCEWVRNAPELVTGFYVYQAETIVYEPGNLERSLAAYQHFVETQFPKVRADDPIHSSVGYVITTRMGDLYSRQGDRYGGIDKTLEGIEAHGGERSEVDLFRAQLILNQANAKDANRSELNARAAQILSRLVAINEGYPPRKALILLAEVYQSQNNLKGALSAYRDFATRYPSSPYAWLASISAAQCLEKMGDLAGAIAAYEALGTTYSQEPLAQVIGPASAGQLLDAQFAFDRAWTFYRRALNAWDDDYQSDVTPPGIPRPTPTATEAVSVQRRVTREGLADRVAQLEASQGSRAGSLIERGRWQLGALQYTEAVTTLTEAEHAADGLAAAEARMLRHRAQLELIFDRLATKGSAADDKTVLKDLTAMVDEPFDVPTGVAGAARALLILQSGDLAEARRQLQTTLDSWIASQTGLRAQVPTPIDADVADVRLLILQPAGALPLIRAGAESAQFNQFPSDARYVLLQPELLVRTADGRPAAHTVYQQFPDFPRALFLTHEEQTLLVRSIMVAGRLQATPPGVDPETGIEPKPTDRDVMALLAEFLPLPATNLRDWSARRHLATDPTIWMIEFTNAARTRANVAVVYGYQGATVMCEKIDGKWRAIKIVNRWIS